MKCSAYYSVGKISVMSARKHLIIFLLIVTQASSSLIRQSIYQELVQPWDVKITGPEYIHLGLVMAGVSPKEHPEQHYVSRLDKMLRSVFSLSQGTALHLYWTA